MLMVSWLSQLTGYDVPELKALTRPMLHEDFQRRPTALAVLRAFDNVVAGMKDSRLRSGSTYHVSR